MSMNVYFEAVRDITVNKTGEVTTQLVCYDVWQTPTNVTYEIVNSKNPVEAYCEWVRKISEDEEIEVLDDNDVVVSRVIVNTGDGHIKDLLEWVEIMRNDSYEIRAAIT